jgi:hypothetical protein
MRVGMKQFSTSAHAIRGGGSVWASRVAFFTFLLLTALGFGEDTLQMPEKQIHLLERIVDVIRPPIRFDTVMLERTAGTGNDLNRVLATDVTSQSTNLLSDNALNIRGGRFDENIYILNGIEFPNLNHFSSGSDGALGFVSAKTLRELKLYAGTTPSEFASSAASTVLVETRSGKANRFGTTLDLSITGGEAVVEGPLGLNSGTFLSQIRFFDLRPLRDWVTTGQVPRFMDGTMSLDLNHGRNSNSRIFGLYTWDRMSTRLPGYDYIRYDRSGRAGLSYSNYLHTEKMSIESGISGLISTEDAEWGSNSSTAAQSPTTSLSNEEKTGRAYVKASIGDEAYSLFQTGVDVKISNPDLVRISLNGEYDTSLANVRSGGFVEYSGSMGPYGGNIGLRAEYFSIYSALGLSPQASVSRKFGEAYRLTLNGSLRYVPQAELSDLAVIALFDDAHPPYELNTLVLKRVWYLDGTFTVRKYGVTYEITGYAKLYDREFKLVDGIHRAYYGGSETKEGRTVSVFADPSGRRLGSGYEMKATGSLGQRLRFSMGISLLSIENEYLDGNFYPDRDENRISAKGTGYFSATKHQLLSLSINAGQGRPIWSSNQILDQDYYSERMPNMVYLSARYTLDWKVHRTRFKAYAEIDNLLNQTPAVYQNINNDGTFQYLSLNGIFPLIGIQVDF